jgi:hypothetical protein
MLIASRAVDEAVMAPVVSGMLFIKLNRELALTETAPTAFPAFSRIAVPALLRARLAAFIVPLWLIAAPACKLMLPLEPLEDVHKPPAPPVPMAIAAESR